MPYIIYLGFQLGKYTSFEGKIMTDESLILKVKGDLTVKCYSCWSDFINDCE